MKLLGPSSAVHPTIRQLSSQIITVINSEFSVIMRQNHSLDSGNMTTPEILKKIQTQTYAGWFLWHFSRSVVDFLP